MLSATHNVAGLGQGTKGQRARQVARCSAARDEDLQAPSPKARLLLDSLRPPAPGAVHGEAFTQMRGFEVVRMDVDDLNERLRPTGSLRLKLRQQPDQANGLIFNLDHMVANTRGALAAAWASLAAAKNLPCPADTSMLVRQCTSPERVMMDVLGWSRDVKAVRALSWELAEHYSQALLTHARPVPGLRAWLDNAANYGMPVAAVSQLDRATVRAVLSRVHLHDHFNVLVCAEDDMETQAQALLSAAMQLQRPPNMCAVFDDTPLGITAAHNASMKVVALASPACPAYRLRAADVTVSSFSSLTIYSIRRLFANSGCELGDLSTQAADGRSSNRRRTATGTL
ncbi:hypothetical protein QJQ45_019257 [Haematococcus lacustris]|nr:hypothetical protein QJQ45_019257 [Haematococcus lacustris]